MNQELERQLFLKGREGLPNILVAAAECAPLSKTGGLADVAGGLPKYLKALGFDARVITPYHRVVREKYGDRVEYVGYTYVDLGWRHEYAGLLKLDLNGLIIYLIDSEYYFGDVIYRGGQPEVEQYAFFQRAVMECLRLLDFQPEILHCNDWHTAFLPFLIKTQYQGRPEGALKTILTIHNIAFQGWMPYDTAGDLFGVDGSYMNEGAIGHWGCANMLKTGCLYADKVNTVSPSYADEIRTIEFGERLEYVLNCRGGDVSGILNGIDLSEFDPAQDPNVRFHYDADNPAAKAENKAALLEELGLSVSVNTPIIAMVTRMTSQKGFDLVIEAMDRMMERDVAFVLLGTGDHGYEDAMRAAQSRHPGRVCAYIGYSEGLARRIYAASDFFLMPSSFEPCGLGQIIAMRYGSLPIVHEVGGLRDTVAAYNSETGEGTGFSFWDFNADTMLRIINYALDVYQDKAVMGRLIHNAMTTDFSMQLCALEYAKLYLSVLGGVNSGLRHLPMEEYYRSPFGAVKCGETVTLRLVAADFDGSAELLANGAAYPMEREDEDAFAVDYTAPAEAGAVRYCFRLSNGVSFGAFGATAGDAEPWQLTVYDADFTVPAWAKGAIMYQILPDRFAPGGDAFDKGVRYHRTLGRHVEVHRKWDDPVKYLPSTRDVYYPDDFYGGTLRGLTDMLPELREMGVQCIYLNPVFESDSNHRCNTADYKRIDPLLGDEGEFRALCGEARSYGIHVVLDGVFTHTGDDSVYFNKFSHYETPGAWQGESSPWYSWYRFENFPEQYVTWKGIPSLPEVNRDDPAWQEEIVRGEDSVLKHWLRRGVDGWRIDTAQEFSDALLSEMRRAVKSERPDALLVGEVWEDATTQWKDGAVRRYAMGGGLDSVMNYPLRAAMLNYALFQCDAAGLRDFLATQKMNYPAPMYHCLVNLLGSHDTARIRTVLGCGVFGDNMSPEERANFRLTEAQSLRGRALQKLLAALQYALPGMPCVYYGDEEGMQGFSDPFCRATYELGMEEESLRDFYIELGRMRNGSEVLRTGDAAFASYGYDVICVLRWIGEKVVLAAVNRGDSPVTFKPNEGDFVGLCSADAQALPIFPEITLEPMDYVFLNL